MTVMLSESASTTIPRWATAEIKGKMVCVATSGKMLTQRVEGAMVGKLAGAPTGSGVGRRSAIISTTCVKLIHFGTKLLLQYFYSIKTMKYFHSNGLNVVAF